MNRLVLASTSRYRRELLGRLRLPFDSVAPEVDETPLPHEAPAALAARLAHAKSVAVARLHPDAVVIGADQAAELDGQPLGKPGSHDKAVTQLQACSGREVLFHSAVCVTEAGRHAAFVDTTRVVFRVLQPDDIARYLHLEQPYDCAGSFKCEGYGVTLFERIDTQDPTALIGLPLIALARTLRTCGFTLP